MDEVLSALARMIWLHQADAMAHLKRDLDETAPRYRKTLRVRARVADGGERVVSRPADGRGSVNTAQPGDYMVTNQPPAREQYVIRADRFAARYDPIDGEEPGSETDEEGGLLYEAKGEVKALTVDEALLTRLKQDDGFYLEADWGEAQIVRKGDSLVAPPDLSEIYRIARSEFELSYTRCEG
ncbi:MAG: hypothetical protein ACPGUC_00295 [Gammaproteobacteria bacterium]